MDEKRFDVVIVGTGTSAYYGAQNLAAAGKNVAIVDEREYGGTCALRGCQPKKYLVANAEAVAGARHLVGTGIKASPQSDWQALQRLKNAFTEAIPENSVKGFAEIGIETFHGRASFLDENSIKVKNQRLRGEVILLATGSNPRTSEIPGAQFLHDSEYFLNLAELPEKIVFIGGGYISFEFAHVAAAAGAAVTILHRSEKPLKAFDQDMVTIICKASEEAGIKVITNEPAVDVQKQTAGFKVIGKSGTAYDADLVIEASGRVPNLSVLDNGKSNVETSARGIVVNQYLQSVSNTRVYAVGDVAATPYQLAPVADREGQIVAENILNGNIKSMDYSVVPSSVFTIPTLATVGLTERAAQASGKNFRVNKGTTVNWPSSKRIGETNAGYKVLIEEGTEKILGAHIARHNAGENYQYFCTGNAVRPNYKQSEIHVVGLPDLYIRPKIHDQLKSIGMPFDSYFVGKPRPVPDYFPFLIKFSGHVELIFRGLLRNSIDHL